MKRKKTIRTIIIAVIVAALIAAAVFLTIALRKDGHGMNAFERSRTAATAHGESVSMLEYVMMFDTMMQNYQNSTLTDEQIKTVQNNAAEQALLTKIYAAEAKKLGLTLTDEELQKCKTDAQTQIDAVVESYTKSLVDNGNYSKAMLDKQIASYYAMLGMNQNQYFKYCEERYKANDYMTKLDEYYHANGSGLDDSEVLDYYHESVKEGMDDYQAGQYSTSMLMYLYGYSVPQLFVPEGFFYVDFIEVSKPTEEEITELFNKVYNEEMTFDELMASDDNVNYYRNKAEGPYAVGDGDYGYLFDDHEDAYVAAKALEIGQFAHSVVPVTTKDDDGNETVTGYTGYMFRRAEGTMCEEGQSGIVKIDYYPSIRENVETGLRQKKWMADAVYNDAVYAYRGTN